MINETKDSPNIPIIYTIYYITQSFLLDNW